jgi:selenium metabolism protein YedF
MGRGDEYLGEILMKAFLHTLTEMEQPPDMVIRYNTGIKLAVKETQTATDLQALADKGSSVLVCGTCANFFNLKESINVGTISNMYDIAGALVKAGRIVCP